MTLIRMCVGSGAVDAPPQRVSTPAAAPVSKPMGQEFAPIPDNKLSPTVAAIVNKTKAISEERINTPAPQATKAPQEEPVITEPPAPATPAKEITAPPPEQNSLPAAQDDFYMPPPEIPPEEFIPPREFSEAPPAEAAATPVEAAPASLEATVDPAEPKPTEQALTAEPNKPEPLVPKPSKLPPITPEFWRSCIDLIPGMIGYMLDDSTASVNADGILEICSDNLLLHNQVKEHGYGELESELGKVIGKSVRALVTDKAPAIVTEERQTSPAIKSLLEKAKQLNIEIVYR